MAHSPLVPSGVSRRTALGGIAGALVGTPPLALAAATASAPRRASKVLPQRATVDLAKRGLQLVITGSGSALADPLRGGASCAIVIDGTILQFDFGRGVMENLMLVGVNPMKLDHVFFTHLHFDHINDYDYYAITTWLAGRQKPVRVYGPAGTREMSDGAIRHMNKANYRFITHGQRWSPEMKDRPSAEPPFIVSDIRPGIAVETDRFKVTSAEMIHIKDEETTSLGYRFDSDYGSIAISGDTGPSDAMATLARDVDILVHECVIADYGMTSDGKFSAKSYHDPDRVYHTTPTGLGKLATQANVKKLVPYHLAPFGSVPAAIEMSSLYYGSRTDAAIWVEFAHAIKQNYSGPVVLAEDRMIFDFSG